MIIEYHMLPSPMSSEDAIHLSVRFDTKGFVPDRQVSLTRLLENISFGQCMSFDDHHGQIVKLGIDFIKRTAVLTVKLDHQL